MTEKVKRQAQAYTPNDSIFHSAEHRWLNCQHNGQASTTTQMEKDCRSSSRNHGPLRRDNITSPWPPQVHCAQTAATIAAHTAPDASNSGRQHNWYQCVKQQQLPPWMQCTQQAKADKGRVASQAAYMVLHEQHIRQVIAPIVTRNTQQPVHRPSGCSRSDASAISLAVGSKEE